MNAEEALACLTELLPHAHLNKLQTVIFQQVWNDRAYTEIAKESGYGLSHIKQTGSELWQLLSQNLGEKVNKTNLQTVLKRHHRRIGQPVMPPVRLPPAPVPPAPLQCDWGDATDIATVCGRDAELATLERWVSVDRCRLIGVFGMGGMGKTTLSLRVAQHLATAAPLEWIIWRSLRNAPPLEQLLTDWLQVWATTTALTLPESVEAKMQALLHHLKTHRCLLVLDNVESIMQPQDSTGAFQPGYEGYGDLLAAIAQTPHQSCLLLTSREQPLGFNGWESATLPVRSLQLPGLDAIAIQDLLHLRGQFSGTAADWQALIRHYSGNPLALKIAASAMSDFFGGNIAQFLTFLQQSGGIFADIRDLLTGQFHRLTPLERQILYWLAINREPISLLTLQADFIPLPQSAALLEALSALERRCFLERVSPSEGFGTPSVTLFTLQPVVLEYVTEQLIQQVLTEITDWCETDAETQSAVSSPHRFQQALLKTHALIKAQTKDYIREVQVRLILQPLIERLLDRFDVQDLDQRLMHLLLLFRGKGKQQTGYLAGNIINLLSQLQRDLSDRDFSHLAIRQAYLKRVNLQRVNLAHAQLSQSVFTESFSPVLSVAFSQDGTLLAAGDVSHEIHVWQVGTQQPLLTLKAEGWVWSVAFSPDGRFLASSGSHSVCLWDVQTGRCVRSLQGYASRIFAIAFSPDGTQLISGSEDHLIRIWAVETGQLLHCLRGHTDEVRAIAVHPSGNWLASTGCDRTIRLWNLRTGTEFTCTPPQAATLHALAFTPTGTQLVCSSDRAIQVWTVAIDPPADSAALTLHQTLQGHTAPIRAIAVCPQGDWFASGSDDYTIRLWSLATGECLRVLPGHTSWISALCFAPSGTPYLLASGSEDQSIRLWDSRTAVCLQTLQGYSNGIWSIACHPHHKQFISAGQDRTVRLWDSETGDCLQILRGHHSWVWSVGFNPDGTLIASSSDDRTIRIWSSNGTCLHALQGHTDQVYSITFNPNPRWQMQSLLASGSLDGTVRLWHVHNGTCLQTLATHSGGVWSVAFNPDGTLLASGSLDQTINLWDVSALLTQPAAAPRRLYQLTGHQSWVRGVAFSPDGNLLASASADGMVKLWEVTTGALRQTLQAHTSAILCIVFSPDNTTFATSGIDGTVRVWHLAADSSRATVALEEPTIFVGHERWVRFLAYAPHDPILMSCSQDETIKFWNLQTGACQQTLRILRPYEGLNIHEIQGLTAAQTAMLKFLGAIERGDRQVA